MLIAKNTNPDVVPAGLGSQGGVWASLGALLLVLIDLIPTLPLPDNVKPWLPLIGAVVGWLAHALMGPEQYKPVPPPKTPDEIDARIAAAVRAALAEQAGAKPVAP